MAQAQDDSDDKRVLKNAEAVFKNEQRDSSISYSGKNLHFMLNKCSDTNADKPEKISICFDI